MMSHRARPRRSRTFQFPLLEIPLSAAFNSWRHTTSGAAAFSQSSSWVCGWLVRRFGMFARSELGLRRLHVRSPVLARVCSGRGALARRGSQAVAAAAAAPADSTGPRQYKAHSPAEFHEGEIQTER